MALFCDMDEVLTDFTGSALALHGWSRQQFERARTQGEWPLQNTLQISKKDFWKPIADLGEDFWFHLKPLPWFKELIEVLDNGNREWYIVTNPSDDTNAHLGKVKWIEKYLPHKVHDVFITKHKSKLARTRKDILIDDSHANIVSWRKAGGSTILFPANGNDQHELAHDPVPSVARRLYELEAYYDIQYLTK